MDQEITKVLSFAVCGLSNLFTTQIQVFMQMLQQRNSHLELLGKLIFNRNITLTYLKNKSQKGWYRLNTGELLQEEWCKNLRIDINTFMTIVEELRPAITPSENSFRRDTITALERSWLCAYTI